MGKVYGKNASGSTQLIIDGDAIDQRLSTLEANWDSISLMSATKKNISLPSGSTSYAQVIFDFDIPEGKKIVAVTSIQTNRPAACAIASFNPLENNKLEVWYKNVLGASTSITVNVTVLAM